MIQKQRQNKREHESINELKKDLFNIFQVSVTEEKLEKPRISVLGLSEVRGTHPNLLKLGCVCRGFRRTRQNGQVSGNV